MSGDEQVDPVERAAFEAFLRQVEDELAAITPEENQATIDKILAEANLCHCALVDNVHYTDAHPKAAP